MDQLFMLPRQSAEQQRGVAALFPGERLFGGPLEVMGLVFLQPGFPLEAGALFGKTLLNHVLHGRTNLDKRGGLSDRQSECS